MLETERQTFRPWCPDDAERYADHEVARHVFNGRPVRRVQILAVSADYVLRWDVRGYGPFAVVDKATSRWIGRLGLNRGRARTRSRSAGSSTSLRGG